MLASSPGASEALGHGRAILLGLAVVAWLVGSVSLRRIYVVATLFAVPAYWVIADTLGRIGGPSTATHRAGSARRLGQMVVATRYVLRATLDRYRSVPGAIGPNLGQLAVLLDRYSAIVRNFLQDLHPRMLEQLGLGPSLRWLASRMQETAGLEVALEPPETLPPLPDDSARAAFRCVQEALTNVAKHAGVSTATMAVRCDVDAITLDISDAGVGFDAADTLRRSTGSGLVGQRERARAVGGDVELHGEPGTGTRVRIRLPLADATMPSHPGERFRDRRVSRRRPRHHPRRHAAILDPGCAP